MSNKLKLKNKNGDRPVPLGPQGQQVDWLMTRHSCGKDISRWCYGVVLPDGNMLVMQPMVCPHCGSPCFYKDKGAQSQIQVAKSLVDIPKFVPPGKVT